MLNVLVIGRSGQLAQALVSEATDHIHLTSLSREQIDMARPDMVREQVRRIRPDGVINASAYNLVDAAEETPGDAFAVNRDGPAALAQACADNHIPLVHVSTDYVFGGEKSMPYLEDDPPAPLNIYGHSKLAGERGVLDAGGSAAIIRTSWVFSSGRNNFVTTMLGLAQEGRTEVQVVSDQVGRPTYAPDLARACLTTLAALADGDKEFAGLLHYCGEGDTSRVGFAEQIFAGARRHGLSSAEVVPISTRKFGAVAARPVYSALDTTRARALPGIKVVDWQSGLDACLAKLAE